MKRWRVSIMTSLFAIKKVAIKTFSRFCHLGVVYLKSISVFKILIGCFNFDWVLIVRRLDTVFQLSILKYFVGVGSKMDVATRNQHWRWVRKSNNVKYEPFLLYHLSRKQTVPRLFEIPGENLMERIWQSQKYQNAWLLTKIFSG